MADIEKNLLKQEKMMFVNSFPPHNTDPPFEKKNFNPLIEADYKKRNLGIRKAELKPKAYHKDKGAIQEVINYHCFLF